MLKPYFVMPHCQNGGFSPRSQEDGELATFDFFEEACESAEDNLLGSHFGFEVFERGCGEI